MAEDDDFHDAVEESRVGQREVDVAAEPGPETPGDSESQSKSKKKNKKKKKKANGQDGTYNSANASSTDLLSVGVPESGASSVYDDRSAVYEENDEAVGPEETFIEAYGQDDDNDDDRSSIIPSIHDQATTTTASSSPPLPDRKPIKDCLRMDLPTAQLVDSTESLVIGKTRKAVHVRSASSELRSASNYLLESKFSQLDKEFQAKDSKSKELINTGTQNIKKTFNDIKNTVGGFGDMFGYKIDWDFWTRVVNDYQSVVMNESDELNNKITRGIPKEFRGIIWQLISKSKNFQLEEFYIHLKNDTSIHEKAIKRDLTRTSFFTHVEQVGKSEELFNVIKAYSLFDPDVGYTQGMIFVGVPLIMNMTDSECFCLLVTIMKEYNLRSLFCPEMKGLHLLLYQFDRLLEMYCPRLFNHLVKQGIKSSMYASQWFLTFFAYKFPLDIVLRIYDIVITQGMESILKFAVNLMVKNESNLLTLRFDKLIEFLKDKLFNFYVNEEYVEESSNGAGGSSNTGLRSSRTASVSRRFSILGKRNSSSISQTSNSSPHNNGYYKLDQLVIDSMTINVLPFDLKKFENEFESIYINEKSKESEIESMREQNGILRHEIKQLETSYSNLHRDHVEIVQEMVDIKVSLPEVVNDNLDLQGMIEQTKEDLADLQSKMEIENDANSGKGFDDVEGYGLKSPSLPTNIESDIHELLLKNAQETEKFANLEDELEGLLAEEAELDSELDILKGNKKWFRW
ncbi:probable GTPase-activating protein Gyl1p [[Candida] railenensis]|uniref:GTPase-activating protein GYP5 n=1 Tax=[Candida] railenensis TaxID=45579 RepID=A0A9P0VZP9_9ASCO|nr:probable GTPase-activating protein Gyl1p [[Candida] railenensis]